VIVIDAGHGGQDAGAEGVNGVYEKDVTLSIARKLRDRLGEILPTTKVVMTRDRDVFIELFRRTQIANESGGKLFISIHCNSMPTKPHPAHGCETYILRPGRNDDAARVASRENSSIRFERSQSRYDGMTEDQIIIATMAQRSFVRLSESFAAGIQKSVRTATPLHDRGVSQAGFFVLVGASMPNVLVETGFLSNTKDAEYLASAKGQRALAHSIADAVRTYASSYERSLNH
jgi:N-acetylmuramoyl-L-alanine amidase